ncbi:hypothetical protein ACG33_03840 [Steroidobacter denitrificans]|uniref:AB hydrolase-1 domain-containing protein n=1 Tax=Steroidobacter denitrificans TaxID=465721 RepID=A0A127F9I1_STEDE|nr:alpha/beta hydrolase [Steroidobacter denitrificans]AMN46250.1 hypothetical protein ACG33_03840 [Steroidobacter denitrificans]
MTSFVLVHGGSHGAWCWERLIPHLQADSRVESVVAVDLTGHGTRRGAKSSDAITLADYIDDVVGEIETRNLHEVVLVGHSLAGITLPRAAERITGRIRRLIYLSTSNPPAGQSIADLMRHPLSPVSRRLDARGMFCNDLDDDAAAWLLSKLEPEPPGPMREPVPTVAAAVGLKSTYILLERDAALPPAYQREQARNAGVDEVVAFEAGHDAFISRPRELADILLRYT